MAKDVNDPLFDSESPSMASRILPPLILICALGGFIALAIYAYRAGSQSVGEGELVVIEADKGPLKEKPQDPGGMQFPNQDKTIFETFSGNQKPAAVERVLPTPEEPIAQDAPATPAANWANEKLAAEPVKPADGPPPGAEQVFGDDDTPPVKTAEPQVLNVQEELAKQESVTPAAPVAQPVVQEPVVAKPVDLTSKKEAAKPAAKEEKPAVAAKEPVAEPAKQDVQEVPVAEVKVKAQPVAEKPIVKAEPKPAEKPKTSTGKSLIQLGAYKSEAEAKADFAKMQKKNAALAGKSPVINRADLGDKGIFFRLRVNTDDAKALCSKLSASGQACMVVK